MKKNRVIYIYLIIQKLRRQNKAEFISKNQNNQLKIIQLIALNSLRKEILKQISSKIKYIKNIMIKFFMNDTSVLIKIL